MALRTCAGSGAGGGAAQETRPNATQRRIAVAEMYRFIENLLMQFPGGQVPSDRGETDALGCEQQRAQ